MKKLLALGLSLAMMASLSAVAFAASGPEGENTITATGGTAETVVKTVTEGVEAAEERWTVTIPAAINIDWKDANAVSGDVNVKGQINKGASVSVKLNTPVDGFQLTNGTDALDCTITFEGLSADANQILGAGQTTTVSAQVAADEWLGVPVAVYQNTLTFEATYNAATV